MKSIAISIKNVSKYYKLYDKPKDRLKEALNRKGKTYHRKFYATKNLNLEIKKGEILGVVGKNGSGKSTLLKLITGVLQPDEGTIEVNGKISALLELGSGFNPEFTGIQNIFFYGTILGFSKEEMQSKLDDILDFADIGDFIHQPLKTYSSGMKSRLGFAVAVHIDPEILILDEVLAVGDVLFRRKCYAKMEEFFKSGKTIIYVSHDANSIKELCSRAIFLHNGNILMDADANTITKYYQKYIFSDNNKKEKIIQEIVDYKHKTEVCPTLKENTSHQKIILSSTEAVKDSQKQEPYFIDGFKPQNMLEYRMKNIDILSPRIKTLEGKEVNVLVYGETYCYEVIYDSQEKTLFKNVAFGIDFHTEKGTKVTSIESVLAYKHEFYKPTIEPYETIKVTFEFQCLLPVGDYFVNNGCSSFVDSKQNILNRKVDIYCFKVQDFSKRITDGQSYLFKKVILNNNLLWEEKTNKEVNNR